ncbi:MAG TPA: iron ABC transporter permease [Chitinolyticbacter sp.]|nr:iron ABC transporter permease [Chitinolyticbacter sp.]
MMGSRYWVWRGAGYSLRASRRQLAVNFASLILLLGLALFALGWGDVKLAPDRVWAALIGDVPGWQGFLLREIRLPRVLAALVVGAALGLSGLLLQTLARNRLASPDMIGLNDGATLAMALTLLWSPAGLLGPWWMALCGALVTTLVILAAAGGMGSQGYRVIVAGIAVASLFKAGFELVLATLPVMHSSGIYVFSIGSLVGRGYPVLWPALAGLGVLVLILLPLARGLGMLGLSDDMAQGLGVGLSRMQLAALLVAAALAGLAVSVAGPVGFVAIVAPIVARRLAGPGCVPLCSAASLGAFIVLLADTLGRSVAAPAEVPAGVVTGVLGGPFLLWVLLAGKGRA